MKKISIIFYGLALICYGFTFILHFVFEDDSLVTTAICAGSAFLCLGSVIAVKNRKKSDTAETNERSEKKTE